MMRGTGKGQAEGHEEREGTEQAPRALSPHGRVAIAYTTLASTARIPLRWM